MSSILFKLYALIMLASFTFFTFVILIEAESFSDETNVFPPLEYFDKDQIESNQQELKSIVLKISKPCKTLHDHLKSTPESLDWITKQGTETMLHLAILLDKAFNRELLSMILRN